MAPTAFALRDSQLAAYHGVEHKAIAGYEQDTDAALVAKEHDRCGSNLVAPMMHLDRRGQPARALRARRCAGRVAGTAVTLAGVAVSVEMFAWSERNRETALAQAFRRPGLRDAAPVRDARADSEQLEVGRAALIEILRLEAPAARLDKFTRNRAQSPSTLDSEPLLPWLLADCTPPVHDGLEQGCFRSQSGMPFMDKVESWALTWMPILLMGALVYLIWRS